MKTLLLKLALAAPCILAPWAGAQEPLFTTYGPHTGAGLGRKMDRMGDLNGDGVSDFLCSGVRYVSVRSGADGSVLHSTSNPIQWYGDRIASIGDANGDALCDYVIGEPTQRTVWVRSGVDGSVIHQWTHTGPEMMGAGVAAAGDWDQDGLADFLVGFPGAFAHLGDPNLAGFARVYSGRDATVLREISPKNTFGFFGAALCMVGDVNGDGVGDIAVGADQDTRAWLFSGADGKKLFGWQAAVPSDSWFGWALAAPGDVDGDGVPDVLVTDPGWETRRSKGAWFLYSGATGTTIFAEEGAYVCEGMGWSVGVAGDVDGDGATDWLVGATGKSNPKGSTYLYSGRGGGLLYEFVPPSGGRVWFGSSVIGGDDVNGDGFPDLLIGAVAEDDILPNMGAVTAFAGNDLFLNASPKQVSTGGVVTLRLGQASAGSPSLLVIQEINGVPCGCSIFGIAPLASDGFREVTTAVDPNWAGLSFSLQGFVLEGPDLLDSGVETVVIQ